jgi:glycine oxidase
MSKPAEHDYLILGQGLAGSLLGWNLIQRGCRVMLIDDAHASSSSMVAAGLINPLAGRRLVFPWEMDAWLAAATETYTELEQSVGKPLYHRLNMLRLFQDAGQLRFWERLQKQPAARNFFGEACVSSDCGPGIHAPLGGFTQYHTGYVDLPGLLDHLREQFIQANALTICSLDYTDISLERNIVSWRQFRANQLVCCEGWRAQANPWFSWLPFTPDKGEFLTLKGGSLPEQIVNGRHMAIPLATGDLRFGSTHEHEKLDNQPTDDGRRQLLTGLQQLLSNGDEFQVTAHQAGVRPATQDRQPLLGSHPEYDNLHIFNGFGAKGTLTIPWHARLFTDYLQNRASLPEAVDITRFSK